MNGDKIRIVIDCDEDTDTPQHWLSIGEVSRCYESEADLADDLELILNQEDSLLAA